MEYKTLLQSTEFQPLVSVIIPMYNVVEYIEETINSVLNQSIERFEVIFIDDGSTDETLDVVSNFVKNLTNVTLVQKENSGPGMSRNLGILLARGEYISFVDSDDLIPSDALENMYNAAKENDAEVVTGMSQSFNSKRSWFIASHMNSGAYNEGFKDLFNNPEMLFTLGPCNKMFKRALLNGVEYPSNIKVTEDHPFILHAYLKANKIYTLEKIIYFYRQREDEDNVSLSQLVNINSAPVIKDIFNSLKISDKLWDKYIDNKYIRGKIKQNYYNRIIKADLWPAFNKAIKSKESTNQKEALQLILNWLNELDKELLNKLPLISHMLTFQVLNRYLYLSKEAKEIHKSIIIILFEKLSPDLINILLAGGRGKEIEAILKVAKRKSTFPIYSYLGKRKFSKKINSIKKKFETFLTKKVVFHLAKLMPINKKKVVFATNKSQRFEGTFKYIYEEMISENYSCDIVGHYKGIRNFKENFKLYYDLGTAKYILLDDYYFQMYGLKTRKDTRVVQLWHAAGAFKKFGFSSIGSIDSNPIEFEQAAHQNYTDVIVSSSHIIPYYAEAFGVSEEKVHPLGVPRADVFLDEDYKEYIYETYLNTYPEFKGKKIITYAPTFRGRPGERNTFNLELDLEKLYQAFGDEYIVILKMHPSVTKGVHIPKAYSDFAYNLSKNDVNNVLILTDILITDYSSIIFDYSLLKRPMIFFAYDLDDYLDERGFYEEYHDFVPGPIVKSTDEIIETIKENRLNTSDVSNFADKYFEHLDGNSAKRIVKHIFAK